MAIYYKEFSLYLFGPVKKKKTETGFMRTN